MVQLIGINETDKFINAIYEAVGKISNKHSKENRNYLGMSQIGHPCERNLWFVANSFKRQPVEGRIARIFANGHSSEERTKQDIRNAGYTINNEQLLFKDFNGRFRGHCDGTILGITKKEHLYEYKTANDASFKKFKKNGLKINLNYEAQMHCYMGYGEYTRGLFLVENKNTQELYAEIVRFDLEKFVFFRNKAQRILEYTEKPLITIDEKNYLCQWCDYKFLCSNEKLYIQEFNIIKEKINKEKIINTCLNCKFFCPKEETKNNLVLVIKEMQSILNNIKVLKVDITDTTEKEALIKKFISFLGYKRPDLEIPTNIFFSMERNNESIVPFFMLLLQYMLNAWTEYSSVSDSSILNSQIIAKGITDDWCAKPKNKKHLLSLTPCINWVLEDIAK